MELFEKQYVNLVSRVFNTGEVKAGRNGNTLSIFGASLAFDLQVEFPILRGRRMYFKGVLGELAAMLRQPKHLADFEKWGCNYWAKWAKPDGSIAVDYGNTWFNFNGVDQIAMLRKALWNSPDSRRMVISGWRPGAEVDLPCCHYAYQFYVRKSADGQEYLDMLWHQRSADTMIGVPSDAVFAAAWMIAICAEVKHLKPGRCFMTFGDTHIYEEHLIQVPTYIESADYELSRESRPVHWSYSGPEVVNHFAAFEPSWVTLAYAAENYRKINFVLKD